MLKFTEHLVETNPKKVVKNLFTDKALYELKQLVKEDNNNNNNSFTVPFPKTATKLDITEPAKIITLTSPIRQKNLFSLPSIITVLFFVFSTIYVDYDAALEDGAISRRERLKIIYLLLGAVATLVSRGAEGKTEAVVPGWLPGPKRDLNNDGTVDEQDYHIWNKSSNE